MPSQPSLSDTADELRQLGRNARVVAEGIERLHEHANTLSAAGRAVGWPIPLAWFWEWHNALQAWADRLDHLADENPAQH